MVAVVVDPRAHRGKIGAGTRLGEPLTPDLLGRQDFRQIALLLVLRTVEHDRRPGHAEADHAHVRRRLGPRELLEHDRLMAVRRASPAVLLGPGQPGVTGVEDLPRPLARLARGQVRLEPGADTGAEGGFVRGVAEVDGAIEPLVNARVYR